MVVDEAYATCLRLAREHYENFPVASRLLRPDMRPHIAAIYAFARLADDFADEGDRTDSVRLALLDDWDSRLSLAAAGTPPAGADESAADAVFTALSVTIHACNLDVQLLADLVSAFRQDVTVKRYDNWESLLDYCRRSANPIGRLVLSVAGHQDRDTAACSDAMCTALQLTNFWQDLESDWRKGRLYVPTSIATAAGALEEDLGGRRMTPAWREALREVAARTRTLFEAGRPVADAVDGRLRWELRATWLGGMRVLEQLERGGFDVFRHRPSLGWRDAAPILAGVVAWRRP